MKQAEFRKVRCPRCGRTLVYGFQGEVRFECAFRCGFEFAYDGDKVVMSARSGGALEPWRANEVNVWVEATV